MNSPNPDPSVKSSQVSHPNLRSWERTFLRPLRQPGKMDTVWRELESNPELLRWASSRARLRPECEALLARAYAGLGNNGPAREHANRSARLLQRALLRSGGEPRRKQAEAHYRTLLLLGDVFLHMGQKASGGDASAKDFHIAGRHYAAALLVAGMVQRKYHQDDLWHETVTRIGDPSELVGGHPRLGEWLAGLRPSDDAPEAGGARTSDPTSPESPPPPSDSEQPQRLRALGQFLASPEGQASISPDVKSARSYRWLSGTAWQRPLPALLGGAEEEWTRLKIIGGLKLLLSLFALSLLIFFLGEVVLHFWLEKSIDALLDRARTGFLPDLPGQPWIEPRVQLLLLVHLGLLCLFILPFVWWLCRMGRLVLTSVNFSPPFQRLKNRIGIVAASSFLFAGLGFLVVHGQTNLFRTAFSVLPVLRDDVPADPLVRAAWLGRVAGALNFRARNQIDNYLRARLSLSYEALKDYDAALRTWQKTNGMAYMPFWQNADPKVYKAMVSRLFVEYDVQIAHRLRTTFDYERRLVDAPDDARLLADMGTYLLGHGRLSSAIEALARSLRLDPASAGLLDRSISGPEAGKIFRRLPYQLAVSTHGSDQDLGRDYLEAVTETRGIHRLAWAVKEALKPGPFWSRDVLRTQAEAAIDSVLQVVEQHASHPTAQLNLAEFLGLAGRFQEADKAFDRADQEGNLDAAGNAAWGCTLYALKEYRQAVRAFRAASADVALPMAGDALIGWAGALVFLERRTEAEARFLQAIERDPSDPLYHLEYGKALNAWGDYEAAVREFEATEGHFPFLEAFPPWAYALNQLGRSQEALKAVFQTLRSQAYNPAFYSGAVTQTLRGLPKDKYPPARDALIKMVTGLRRDFDASWKPDLYLAKALCRTGDEAAAAQVHSGLEVFVPFWDRLGWMTRPAADYILWGWMHLEARQIESAKKKFEMALQASPDDPKAQLGLATALARLGRWDAVDQAFEKALRAKTDPAEVSSKWARLYAQEGQPDKAYELFRQASQAGIRDWELAREVALALVPTGRGKEALDLIEQAAGPHVLPASFARARISILVGLDRWKEAGDEAGKALESFPDDLGLLEAFGIQRLGDRDFEKAAEHLDRATPRQSALALSSLYLFIARMQRMPRAEAVNELRQRIGEVRHNYWPAPLFRFAWGEITLAKLLEEAADRVDPEEMAERLSQAHYLAGETALASGDAPAARQHWDLAAAQKAWKEWSTHLARHLLAQQSLR
ncbi:MAG: tetratricopeptide repeat protein [Planctomycetes bacterium]|nr:tetratricopeptide repeat protein [Planctomycetota bacterium]